jgi:hypothetical protein
MKEKPTRLDGDKEWYFIHQLSHNCVPEVESGLPVSIENKLIHAKLVLPCYKLVVSGE